MLFGFDLDGTLANSKSVYYQTVQEYADTHHFELPTQHEMNMAFGSPTPPLFKGWGDVKTFKMHLDTISDIIDRKLCENPDSMPLYPGIFDLLEALHKNNILLAIVTSRELAPVKKVLEANRILSFFNIIRSGKEISDQTCEDKPHPDLLLSALNELKIPANKSIMIGDTWMDIEMAKKAQVFAVGVTWGYHTPEVLEEQNPNLLVNKPDEISKLLDQFQG